MKQNNKRVNEKNELKEGPDFLFIGPDKTGSSWLYTILREHPDCFVPPAKDIWFFDEYYDRGMEWYLSFFEDAPASAKVKGELSHNYLFSPEAAERIATDLPEVKLITCLRDPAERTFSQYLYLIRSGVCRLDFEEAIDEHPRLIDNSLYYKHLSTYFEFFSRDQIKVLWFSKLKRNSEAFASEVFEFLDLPHVPGIDYDQRVRPAGQPRSFFLAKAVKQAGRLVRELGLANLVGRVKNNDLVNRLFFQSYGRDAKPELGEEMERKLRERFRDDVLKLEKLLGKDLEDWLPEGMKEEGNLG